MVPLPDHVPPRLSNTGSARAGLMLASSRQAAPAPNHSAEEFNRICQS
jgi:hypothetical protein